MPTMRGWAGPVALSAGAAFALWLSFGALAVSEASIDARIGLTPPLWQLGLLLALGFTLAVAAVRHRVRLAPLAAFIFLVLPWLPLPLPASALVWTGPMARVLLLLVASSIAALWFEEHRGAGSRVGLLAVWSHPHRAPALAAILAFSLYLAAAWQMREVRPNGDEPHYLVITQSLLKDGDLQIQNNHHQDDYLAYWTTLLAPDYLRRGTNGAIYSVHAPGLAVLVAPAFALAGYGGVVVFLTLIAALASALAWRVGWLASGSASAAWFAWAAVALSPPYFFLAGAIYPDGPAAACSLVVVCVLLTAERALSRGEPSHLPGRTMCLFGGVALAFLPWLHGRYAATAALLGMVAAWRLWRAPAGRDRAIALLAPAVASAVAWFTFFYVIYGTPNPSAPYGTALEAGVGLMGTGVPGLLFDQQFGLLCYAPVLAGAVVGWVRLARIREYRCSAIAVLAAVVPPLLLGGAYQMWWGGFSSAARFAVPGVLVLAAPIAVAWKAGATATGRMLQLLALVASLALTCLLALARDGGLVYNNRDGYAPWLEWLNDLVNLPVGFPSYFRDSRTIALEQTAIWIGLILLAWASLRLIEQRISRAAAIALGPFVLALAVMVALSSVWRLTGDQPLNTGRSQVTLLAGMREQPIPWVFDFRMSRWLSEEATLTRISIAGATRRGRIGVPDTYFALPHLPAGTYHLRTQHAAPFDLDVSVGRPAGARGHRPFDSLHLAAGGDPPAALTLPVDAYDVRIIGDDRAQALGELTLEPVLLNRDRASLGTAHRAARYPEAVVFFLDRAVYPDRDAFWVRGSATTQFVVKPSNSSAPVSLLLRNGPLANQVTIHGDGWHQSFSMNAGEEQLLTAPATARDATRFEVSSEATFVPRIVDRSSADVRRLGVWVALR